MKSYRDKLKDPRWQKKRLKIMERDKFSCVYCGDGKTTLHVHHKKYVGEPWDCPDNLLETLCEDCHSFTHEKNKENLLINKLGFTKQYLFGKHIFIQRKGMLFGKLLNISPKNIVKEVIIKEVVVKEIKPSDKEIKILPRSENISGLSLASIRKKKEDEN